MISDASHPAIKPTTIVDSKFMSFLPWLSFS